MVPFVALITAHVQLGPIVGSLANTVFFHVSLLLFRFGFLGTLATRRKARLPYGRLQSSRSRFTGFPFLEERKKQKLI